MFLEKIKHTPHLSFGKSKEVLRTASVYTRPGSYSLWINCFFSEISKLGEAAHTLNIPTVEAEPGDHYTVEASQIVYSEC